MYACDLDALTPDERRRHAALTSAVRTSIRSQVELENGYRYTLDTSADDICAWIALESRCCPFLRFILEVSTGTPITLSLSGDQQAKSFTRLRP